MNADNPNTNAPEEWRSLAPIGASHYQVSSYGRIRSLRTCDQHGQPYVMAPALTKGRPNTRITMDDGRAKTVYVHRLVCRMWHGPKPGPGYSACHRNDVPADCTPENLYWGTAKQNAQDRKRTGADNTGLPSYGRRGKLPLTTVRAVRRAIDDGMETTKIAAQFGLEADRVYNIATGAAYKWVADTTSEQERLRLAEQEKLSEAKRQRDALRLPAKLDALDRIAPPREQRRHRAPHTPPASSPRSRSSK